MVTQELNAQNVNAIPMGERLVAAGLLSDRDLERARLIAFVVPQKRAALLELLAALAAEKIRKGAPDPVIEAAQGRALGIGGNALDDPVTAEQNGHVRRLLDQPGYLLHLGQAPGAQSLGCLLYLAQSCCLVIRR